MFVAFFQELKNAGVPVTLREYLTLMQAMEADLASRKVEDFYYLSRAALVKDERNLDKFDRVFGHVFKGLDFIGDAIEAEAIVPGDADKSALVERIFSDNKSQMMPPRKTKKTLTAAQKETLKRWIAAGAEYQRLARGR